MKKIMMARIPVLAFAASAMVETMVDVINFAMRPARKTMMIAAVVLVFTASAMAQTVNTDANVQAANRRFEVQGTITAVTENSVSVWSETVKMPSEKIKELRHDNILKIGNIVNVKGQIEGNTMVAEDVKVIGQNPALDLTLSNTADAQAQAGAAGNGTVLNGIIDSLKTFLKGLGGSVQ